MNLQATQTRVGQVYTFGSPLPERSPEEFAIVDMGNIVVAEPHCHSDGETQIYIVLSGSGTVVVGGRTIDARQGSVLVIPPDTAHFTIPEEDLVLAIVTTPSCNPAHYLPMTTTDPDLGFDREVFVQFVDNAYRKKGLATEHGTDEPGKVYGAHQHMRTRLYTIIGTAEIQVDDRPAHTLQPHQEFIVGANQLHEVVVGNDGWEYVAAWDAEELKSYLHT